MGLRTEAGKMDIINFINFVLRALQFLLGLVLIVMYATQPSYEPWDQFSTILNFSLGIATGALAVATTPFLALIPFLMGYKPIAFACVWDLTVMAVNAAAFGYYKRRFPYGAEGDYAKTIYHQNHVSNGRFDVMHAAVTIDLIGMLLWLITLFMAVGILIYGWIRGGHTKY